MITFEQLEEIAQLRVGRFPVTTLFLNLDGNPPGRQSEILIKTLIKEERSALETQGTLGRDELNSVEQDFEALLRFVQNVDRKGCRALAAFSSSGAGLWQSHTLARPVRNRLVVDTHPHVRPLSSLLHQFRRCLVLLLARDRAVLYSVHLGEIQMLEDLRGDVPSEVHAGGFAGYDERRIERHAEDRLHHFAKSLGELLHVELKGTGAELILIGGAPEAVGAFEASAPRAVKDRCIGRLALGPEAPPADVLEQASSRVLAHTREQGMRIVEMAFKEASRGGMGVAGIAPTLRAFSRGEVSAVAISSGFSRPGLACGKCTALGIDGPVCSLCGADWIRVPDVVEELVFHALGHSLEVVDVEGHPGLEDVGGMVALLRYRRSGPAGGVPKAGKRLSGVGTGRRGRG